MKTEPPATAIVGVACVYPDAQAPVERWEDKRSQRRAFRRLPEKRQRAGDHGSRNRGAPDCTCSLEAAVLERYGFDLVALRLMGTTFRPAGLAQSLALEVAAQALLDAGFAAGKGPPRETAGGSLGNSLTGECSRADLMRLRWSYVWPLVEPALIQGAMPVAERPELLARLEAEHNSPFPPPGKVRLTGGGSNALGGRICNYSDFKGGGHYTVDGACASSLLPASRALPTPLVADAEPALTKPLARAMPDGLLRDSADMPVTAPLVSDGMSAEAGRGSDLGRYWWSRWLRRCRASPCSYWPPWQSSQAQRGNRKRRKRHRTARAWHSFA